MRRGPVLMILASLMFTVMVTAVKFCRGEMSGIDLAFWRGLVSVPLVALTMRGVGFRLRHRRVFLARAAFGVTAMTLYFTATKGMSLVDLNLITRLQPILVGLAAPWVLGRDERAGSRVWLAAAFGLTGAAVILAPDLAVGSLWGVLAFAATCFSAAAHLALRRLAAVEHGRTIVFWFHLFMTGATGLLVLVTERRFPWPPASLWLPVLTIGVFATAGQLLVTKAYASARAPLVAASAYTGVLWSLLADLAVFDLVPGTTALIGGVLVIGATALILTDRHAERAPAVHAVLPER